MLEEEREFFLRSLRDLEAERAAGDIDELDYASLRDDYTVRAAEVLRQLAASEDRAAAAPGDADPLGRSTGSPGGDVPPDGATLPGHGDADLSGGGAPAPDGATRRGGLAASVSSGGGPPTEGPRRDAESDRAESGVTEAGEARPGGSSELVPAGEARGGRAGAVSTWRQPWFVAAAALIVVAGVGWSVVGLTRSPPSAASRVAASDLRAQTALDGGDAVDALKDYEAALAIDATDPVALTGEGEVYVLASDGRNRRDLDVALAELQQAEFADPSYALAYGWRGVGLIDEAKDAAAIPQLRTYLRDTPKASQLPTIKVALADAMRDVASGHR